MERRNQVFISSTYEDLKEERSILILELLKSGFIPSGMETFQSEAPPWEIIEKEINQSDIYILIIAGRYGTVDSEEGISITEREFNYAYNLKLPIHVFIHNDYENLPVKKSESTKKGEELLKRFKEKVSKYSERRVNYWSNPRELTSSVISEVNNSNNILPKYSGWRRRSHEINSQYLEEIYESDFDQPLRNLEEYVDDHVVHKVRMMEYSGFNIIPFVEKIFNKTKYDVIIQILLANPSKLSNYQKDKIKLTSTKFNTSYNRENFHIEIRYYNEKIGNIPSLRGRCIDDKILSMGWYTYETLNENDTDKPSKQVHGVENPMFAHNVTSEDDFLLRTFNRVFSNLWNRGIKIDEM